MEFSQEFKISSIMFFSLLFLASLSYWFYMLYELNELSNRDTTTIKALMDSGTIAKDTMKQNAAFQGTVISSFIIFFILFYK